MVKLPLNKSYLLKFVRINGTMKAYCTTNRLGLLSMQTGHGIVYMAGLAAWSEVIRDKERNSVMEKRVLYD